MAMSFNALFFLRLARTPAPASARALCLIARRLRNSLNIQPLILVLAVESKPWSPVSNPGRLNHHGKGNIRGRLLLGR
jgi:hypothetical protein